MNSYRLFFLDGGGHILRAVEFVCPGDEEAMAEAARHRDEGAVELWSLARKVAALPSVGKDAR